MTNLVLNAAPLRAMVTPQLEAFGLFLSQAIDAFAEARMRSALPARLLRAQLELDGEDASPPRSGLPAPTALGDVDPIIKECRPCSS
jgi:hypothetical protein